MIMIQKGALKNTDNAGTVYSTMDYGRFCLLDCNRRIRLSKVACLKKSIEKEGQLTPIQVREDFSVIDGQHRLVALQELKLPVLFIVLAGATEQHIIELNTERTNWNTMNFSNFYKDQTAYAMFDSFRLRHRLSVNSAHIVLKDQFLSGALQVAFKTGAFALSNEELVRGEARMEKINALCALDDGRFQNKLLAAKVLRGLIVILDHPNYTTERMLLVLMKAPDHKIVTVNKVSDAVTMLKNLFNHKLPIAAQILL